MRYRYTGHSANIFLINFIIITIRLHLDPINVITYTHFLLVVTRYLSKRRPSICVIHKICLFLTGCLVHVTSKFAKQVLNSLVRDSIQKQPSNKHYLSVRRHFNTQVCKQHFIYSFTVIVRWDAKLTPMERGQASRCPNDLRKDGHLTLPGITPLCKPYHIFDT